jgi:hypothetical protein
MTEKKSRERVRPLVIEQEGGTGSRDSLLTTFFRRGEELAREVEGEAARLGARVHKL